MSEKFIPPYPVPHKSKIDLIKRFLSGLNSWIHTVAEKSYTMKLGSVKLPKLTLFIANEEKLVNEIMLDKTGKYPKHHIQHEMLCPLLGESVFSTNGEQWKST
jgi:hypothetical protein